MCKIFIKTSSDVDVCSTVSLIIMGSVNSLYNYMRVRHWYWGFVDYVMLWQ